MPLSRSQIRKRQRRLRYHRTALQQFHTPQRSVDELGRFRNPVRISKKRKTLKKMESDSTKELSKAKDEISTEEKSCKNPPQQSVLHCVATSTSENLEKDIEACIVDIQKDELSHEQVQEMVDKDITGNDESREGEKQVGLTFDKDDLETTSTRDLENDQSSSSTNQTSKIKTLGLGLPKPKRHRVVNAVETVPNTEHHVLEVGEWVKVKSGPRAGKIGKILQLDEENCRVDFDNNVQLVLPVDMLSLYEN